MVIPGHERKSIDLSKHMLLDIVDHGALCIFLDKFRDYVPHSLAKGSHVLLERCLQIRNKDTLRFGTRIAQGNIVLASCDSSNVMLDDHSLNYWSEHRTAGGRRTTRAEASDHDRNSFLKEHASECLLAQPSQNIVTSVGTNSLGLHTVLQNEN
jgi:hypothetical protein